MKLSADVIKTAITIIEEVFANGFHGVLDGTCYSWVWRQEHEDILPDDFYFASGCTKLVMVHPALENWVLKFPTYISPNRMARFVVDDEEPAPDHCAQEVRNYERAVREGLADYFAACYKLMDYEGCAIYIQEKASCDASQCSEIFYDSMSQGVDREEFEDEDEYCDYINNCVDEMTDEESLVAMFGSNSVYADELDAFIHKYYIGDLHAGNFGFIGNRPVMVDYSGY